MGDADPTRMISKKTLDSVLKGAIAAMPAIPYITKRKSSMVLPFVLGGIGFALMGGMAAVMFLSPRTRYRAIDAAKNTYGKVESQITQLRNKAEAQQASVANGLSHENGMATGYTATGL